MSFTDFSNHDAKQEHSVTRPRARLMAIRNTWEIDKVTALAILAASAIFAPFALVVLNQAAQIFAH